MTSQPHHIFNVAATDPFETRIILESLEQLPMVESATAIDEDNVVEVSQKTNIQLGVLEGQVRDAYGKLTTAVVVIFKEG